MQTGNSVAVLAEAPLAREPDILETIPAAEERVTEITPRALTGLIDWREVWQYRELLFILAARDIRVRYKQTLVGALWAILQPLATMTIFLVLFALLGQAPTTGQVPYGITLLAAQLGWHLFAHTLTHCSMSLVSNQQLVTRVYFPRVVLPISAVLSGLVDVAIILTVLGGAMAVWGISPGWQVVFFPLFFALLLLASLGAGLWLSAMNALYRDIVYVVPFLIQLGFYLSPVVYETQMLIPERWRLVYAVNPLVGILDGFRWTLLDGPRPSVLMLAASVFGTGVLVISGAAYFRRMERFFADRI
jgi:lipopolysaccharide transport system permease protein